MVENDIVWMSASEVTGGIRTGCFTAADVAEAMIERIQAVNPVINALVHCDPDRIRRDALALDARHAAGEPMGPLFGIPYTIKELTPVAGVPHTLGFEVFKDRIAGEDAIVVERMRAADGLYLGQTNISEAGYCAVSRNRLFGSARNPWN